MLTKISTDFSFLFVGPCVDQDVTLDILKALASGNKFDLYNQDWSGSSGLHHAATKGNITAVKFILDNSAANFSKIDLRDKLGNTPLHKAALEGKANIADYLLRHGADIKCICNFHQNAIHKAALNGYANVVEVIRKFDKESYKELMQHKDIGKSTVLHLAVYGGSIDIVQMLKELGYLETQLKQKNESGETALHRAARRNLTTFINIFLDHGADVNSENSKGQTPLHIASENGHKEAVNALIRDEINLQPRSCTRLNCKDNYYQTPLMAALIKGDESVFNVLNEAGAMIDVKNNRGQNLIHILVEHNKLQLLDDILNKITKERIYELLNDNDFMEENPLHIAARVGNLKEIWSILKAFISKDEYAQLLKVKNDYEESPFHIATKSGNIELMSEIINAFPESVYQLAKDGNTASHLAAKHNQPVSLQLLLEKNLELTPFNAHFKTPLDCAAEAGSKECIKILLSSGYVLIRTSTSNNFNENNESRTLPNNPLHLAAKNGHHDIVKILLDEGADITVKDLEGKTAMQLALENDKKSVVEVILSSSSWEQSLRTAFLEKENEKILTTPIRILIKNYPDLAEMVLDRCSNERNGDLFFSIEFIEDNYLIKSKSETSEFDFIDDDDYLENNYEESTDLSKMIHPMELMLNERQENLLKHPLTIALTKFKWSTYGRCLFIFEAVIYTLFLVTFSAYSFLTLKDAKIKSANKTLNETATKELCVGLENWFLPTITTIKGLSMFFIILCFNFELSKFTSCKKYRTTLALKLSIYISVFSCYLVYHEVIVFIIQLTK